MPNGNQLDYIKQAQIIQGLASGVHYRKLAKEIGLSVPTVCRYQKVFSKEIEESRERLRNKILDTGDKVIGDAFLNIANLATDILKKNLEKYKADGRELKPNELSYISIIGATAVDKNRVIENKPTNINHNPVVFNFTVYKPGIEGKKQAEVIENKVLDVVEEKPLLEVKKPRDTYNQRPPSMYDAVDKSAYKPKKQRFTVVTRYKQPDGTFSDKPS